MPEAELAQRSHETERLKQGLISFYSKLSKNNLDLLNDLYSSDVEFVDPVTSHSGINNLVDYFERLLDGCLYCNFEIKQLEMRPDGGWLQWRMSFANKKLNAGKEINVDGFSILKNKDGIIIYQRDYYDLGAMIYEHIPLLGRLVKTIRKKLG